MSEIVWLKYERTFARLVSLGAHYSIVCYTRGGIDYELAILNDEYTIVEGEDDSDED